MKRKLIWSFVALFAVCVFTARWEVGIPCDQCGKETIKRCLLARAAAGFDNGFLHQECVDQWCEEHPIQFDEEGCIIAAEPNRYIANPISWIFSLARHFLK